MSSRTQAIEQKALELLQPVLDQGGYELVDLEYVREAGTWYLRAYCDKEGGITVDDCEIISRAFETRLDEADLIDEAYILEVSSPGLGRPLKKEKDFQRAMGGPVEVRTYKAVDGEKEFYGTLLSYDADKVVIELEDDAGEKVFPRTEIALIRMNDFD